MSYHISRCKFYFAVDKDSNYCYCIFLTNDLELFWNIVIISISHLKHVFLHMSGYMWDERCWLQFLSYIIYWSLNQNLLHSWSSWSRVHWPREGLELSQQLILDFCRFLLINLILLCRKTLRKFLLFPVKNDIRGRTSMVACCLVLSVSSNYNKSRHKKPQLVILLPVLWCVLVFQFAKEWNWATTLSIKLSLLGI